MNLASIRTFISDKATAAGLPMFLAVVGIVVAGRYVPSLKSVDVQDVVTVVVGLGLVSAGQKRQLEANARFAPEFVKLGELVAAEDWLGVKTEAATLSTMADHEIELAAVKPAVKK